MRTVKAAYIFAYLVSHLLCHIPKIHFVPRCPNHQIFLTLVFDEIAAEFFCVRIHAANN